MCEEKTCINCKYMRTSYSEEPCKSCDRMCRSNWVEASTRRTTFDTGVNNMEENKMCCNCKYMLASMTEEPCKSCDRKCKSNWVDRSKPDKFKLGEIVVAKSERRVIEGMKNIYIYLREGWVLRIPYHVAVDSSYILSISYRQRKYMIDKFIANDIAIWENCFNLEYASPEFIAKHDDRAKKYYVTETLNEWFSKLMKKEPVSPSKTFMKDVSQFMDEGLAAGIDRFNKYPTLNANFIKRVIFSDPATIVFWEDGTKTVVKTQDGEKYDKEKGLAMAISKRVFGNERDYYNVFKRWMRKGEEKC